MNKKTKAVIVTLILVTVGLVGVYTYFVGRARTEATATLSPVQKLLTTDLERNYPGTVREVVKLYTEIEKCLHNEDYTDEEGRQLALMARMLYDDELLEANDENMNVTRWMEEIAAFKKAKKRLTGAAVASAANVETFTDDGHSFARISCGYTVREGNNPSKSTSRVYLLRRDENRKWKIYGWESGDKVKPGGN